jgi:hypothetical protein
VIRTSDTQESDDLFVNADATFELYIDQTPSDGSLGASCEIQGTAQLGEPR